MDGVLGILVLAVAAWVIITLIRLVKNLILEPLLLRKYYERQGFKGPSPAPVFGNVLAISRIMAQAQSSPMSAISHDIVPRVLPYYNLWVRIYGKQLLFWFGNKARLSVVEPELIKEILGDKNGVFPRESADQNPLSRMLLGGGLASLSGHTWARHRKILNPVFHLDRLKEMIPTVCECCELMLQSWRDSAEVDVNKDFRRLTADVISRTAFGSNYEQGNRIFSVMANQLLLIVGLFRRSYVPVVKYFPSKTRRECLRMDKEIRQHIKEVIWAREKSDPDHLSRDLLGKMLAANRDSGEGHLSVEEIVDECKTFYLAGHETTSALLSWTMILLALNQQWQEKARHEVLQVFSNHAEPDAESINRLHTVGMILNEALRLYPPAVFLLREAAKDTVVGGVSIEAGTQFFIPILYIHHDPDLWGEDANEFNPERFREGAAKAAKHPLSFLPLGFGPMNCIGQNFALLEAKTVLAMILQRFSFDLSPSYSHAPAAKVILQPQNGAQLILHKI